MERPCFEWTLRWVRGATRRMIWRTVFVRTIDGLALIYPHQTQWFWGNTVELLESEGEMGRYPLATIRPNLPKAIERNACMMEGYDEPFPEDGFFFVVGTNVGDDHLEKGLLASDGVGSTYPSDNFANDLSFEICSDFTPSYALFVKRRYCLRRAWEATCGVLCPAG